MSQTTEGWPLAKVTKWPCLLKLHWGWNLMHYGIKEHNSNQIMRFHTCHISHCEIKSHRIMPIWKLIPRRIFKSHRIFQESLCKSKHKSHCIVSIRSLLKLNKGFKIPLGSLKANFVQVSQNFIRSHLKFCLISQISVHSLWHVCVFSILPLKSLRDQLP